MSSSDFLFFQWKNVGEIVMTPSFDIRNDRRTYHMVVSYTEKHEVTEKAMQQCLHDLAHVAHNNEQRILAFPLVDRWWNRMIEEYHVPSGMMPFTEPSATAGSRSESWNITTCRCPRVSRWRFPGNPLVFINCMLISCLAYRRAHFHNSPGDKYSFPGSV